MTKKACVLDSNGRPVSPCAVDKARVMLEQGRATLVTEDPLTIQLQYAVKLPPEPESADRQMVGAGRSVLLHTCCGPCSTYTVKRLREQGFEVSGFWYNPNVHPFEEHQKRLSSMEEYAESVRLPLVPEEGYELVSFIRATAGHEAHGERCRYCYELRLARTAMVAARDGFDAFTTTLLISPHQDQDLLREIGGASAEGYGVEFHYENFRRGWSERGRLTREHDLYRQQYCGCIYSEWERRTGEKISPQTQGCEDE